MTRSKKSQKQLICKFLGQLHCDSCSSTSPRKISVLFSGGGNGSAVNIIQHGCQALKASRNWIKNAGRGAAPAKGKTRSMYHYVGYAIVVDTECISRCVGGCVSRNSSLLGEAQRCSEKHSFGASQQTAPQTPARIGPPRRSEVS